MSRVLCRNLVCALLAFGLFAGCSNVSKEEEAYVEEKVEPAYNKAMDALQSGDYGQATLAFNEVERQHPYSVWATKAQLMAAYSSYLANDYDAAIAALDRFIRLHPGNRDIAYAYYLRALSLYEQISDTARDQNMTRLALQSLEDVTRRFPQSKYARDAKLKIDLARDHLAGKELVVGRFYLRRQQYLAAINRFRKVIDEYQTTTHVPEALHRLVEAYTALGIPEEATRFAAVLGHNYPDSDWYADAYELAGKPASQPRPTAKGAVSRILDRLF